MEHHQFIRDRTKNQHTEPLMIINKIVTKNNHHFKKSCSLFVLFPFRQNILIIWSAAFQNGTVLGLLKKSCLIFESPVVKDYLNDLQRKAPKINKVSNQCSESFTRVHCPK